MLFIWTNHINAACLEFRGKGEGEAVKSDDVK